MEQNDMDCQAPQAPILCVNNCGFFGTAATMNMCSKCYKDTMLKEEQAKLAASSIESIVNGSSSSSSSVKDILVTTGAQVAEPSETLVVPTVNNNDEKPNDGPKRCTACMKRVGLMGFSCRCGNLFCAVHRYSDKHDCNYDYHAAAQDAIAKANPVIKAEKLDKI